MTKPKGTNPKGESQRGEKRQYLREAIETLGLDAKYLDAADWVRNKYGVEVSDPTFYHLRKEMQLEAGKRPQDRAAEAPARGGEPTPPSAASQAETPSAGITATESGGPGRSQGGAEGTRTAAEGQTAAGSDAQQPAPQSAGPSPHDGVAALVLQAKGLIERLGKDEAKRLIDAL